MGLGRRLGRVLFGMTPPHSRKLFAICSRYVDRFNGDNNTDAQTNGELAFLRRQLPTLRPGAVVFDVGANVGTWVSSALAINPGLNFHCFEPSKPTYARLTRTPWPSNVKPNNIGLGETEEVRELHVVDDGSGMNSLYARRGVNGFIERGTESIDITTIDLYCRRNRIDRIDLLKLDVEGHELAVIKGAGQMLAGERIQSIQFEYGGCNLDSRVSLGDIWTVLAACGFNLYKLYPEAPRRIERYHQGLETFKYSNWVAMRESAVRPA